MLRQEKIKEKNSEGKTHPCSPEQKFKYEKIFKHQFDLPKKPRSPYLYFFEEHRKDLKKKFPKWSTTKINKNVKIDWNKLDKEGKDLYKLKADQERKDYELEIKEKKGQLASLAKQITFMDKGATKVEPENGQQKVPQIVDESYR